MPNKNTKKNLYRLLKVKQCVFAKNDCNDLYCSKDVEAQKEEKLKVYNEIEKYICLTLDYVEEAGLYKFLKRHETETKFYKQALFDKNIFKDENEQKYYDEEDDKILTLNDFIFLLKYSHLKI